MKPKQHPLFFIALLPDETIQREVTGFKHFCADHFDARHALKSPPHITLVSPFRWDEKRLPELCQALDGFSKKQHVFEIGLHDFDCFVPRVLFVAIEPNPELSGLAGALSRQLEQSVGLKQDGRHGFNPHMTIAHRDLDRQIFPKAWAHFSKLEYRRQFLAEGLTLLKHRGGRWETEREFVFG